MYDLLFDNQSHLRPKDLRGYAERLELDLPRYDAEMEDEVYRQREREHIDAGLKSGVRATPTFFIDGQKYTGARPIEELDALFTKLTSNNK